MLSRSRRYARFAGLVSESRGVLRRTGLHTVRYHWKPAVVMYLWRRTQLTARSLLDGTTTLGVGAVGLATAATHVCVAGIVRIRKQVCAEDQ